MPVRKLDHYNILTQKLDETVRFYATVLGMRSAPPPGGDPGAGAWIYDATETPVVHLQYLDPRDPGRKLDEVKRRLGALADDLTASGLEGAGALEHVAFECDGYDELVRRLDQAGLYMRMNDVPAVNLRQIFVKDPNGITIELNFR